MVEVASPSEDEGHLHDRYAGNNPIHSSEPDYYSSLEEK
jgi:hypothetical protein